MIKTITLAGRETVGPPPLLRHSSAELLRRCASATMFPASLANGLKRKSRCSRSTSPVARRRGEGKYNDGTPQARSELSDRLYAGMEASVAATRLVPVDRIVWRTRPWCFRSKNEARYDMAKNRAVVEAAGTPDQERTQAARRLAFGRVA